jgi:hypothetical protein
VLSLVFWLASTCKLDYRAASPSPDERPSKAIQSYFCYCRVQWWEPRRADFLNRSFSDKPHDFEYRWEMALLGKRDDCGTTLEPTNLDFRWSDEHCLLILDINLHFFISPLGFRLMNHRESPYLLLNLKIEVVLIVIDN